MRDMVLLPANPVLDRRDPGQDLLVDRFEVTDGEFADFLRATGYAPTPSNPQFLRHWRHAAGLPGAPIERDTPVRYVSLADAQAFARWRGKAIPTRDEWFRACPRLKDGELPWRGRTVAGACNSIASELEEPTPVGLYELGRAPCGAYDLVGNVAEWTVTEANSSETAWVLGSAYNRHCQPRDEGPGLSRGSPIGAVPTSSALLEEKVGRWVERVAREDCYTHVGFRCVVRDAGPLIDEALALIEPLAGRERDEAIRELLRVGEWWIGGNRLLPFVRQHAFQSRQRWTLEPAAAEGGTLARASPWQVGRLPRGPSGDGGSDGKGDDLVVLFEGRLCVIGGEDGRERKSIAVPVNGGRPRTGRFLDLAGRPALWIEGGAGELLVVTLPDLEVSTVPTIPGEGSALPYSTWLASDPRRAGPLWFVQKVDSGRNGGAHTRVVRVAADGTREALLPGQLPGQRLRPPARASDDSLFYVRYFLVDVQLPQQVRGDRHTVTWTAQWLAGELVSAPDLSVRDRAWLVENAGRWRLERERTSPRDPAVAEPVGDLVGIDAVPSALPLTWLLTDGAGCPWTWSAGERINAPRRTPFEGTTTDLRPGFVEDDDGRVEPVAWTREESGLSLHRLRTRDAERFERLAAELPIEGDVAWAGIAGGRWFALRSDAGDWLGLDLDAPTHRFTVALPREARVDTHLVELAAGGDEALLSCQDSPFGGWLRLLPGGEVVDELGITRPPIRQLLITDLDGDRRADPVVLFDDGRIVALRPPDPASARLLSDFVRVGEDAGADRSGAGR